jgi:hypothetical protein
MISVKVSAASREWRVASVILDFFWADTWTANVSSSKEAAKAEKAR